MQNLSLFPDSYPGVPPTEGVKYIGSKLKIIPYLLQLSSKISFKSVFDGFSGTTRVSQAFARLGYQVFCNDIAVWSKVFATCYLLNKKDRSYYQEIINHLNNLPGKEGWFTENYGGKPNKGSSIQADGLKKPWQIHNTRKLDAIREEIEHLGLPEVEKSVPLTSLILALDEVDNSIGHFASYLNQWAPRSYKMMKMRVPALINSTLEHKVYQDDIFSVAPKVETDLAYYDPPYGSNNDKMPPSRVRYSAYYHLWTTICLNDQPKLFGKVRRRADSSDEISSSPFEEFRKNPQGRFIAITVIEKLIKETKSKYIILSYSSGGRATAEELYQVLEENGKVMEIMDIDYQKNVMAGMRWTNEWIRESEKPNKEFLFLLKK